MLFIVFRALNAVFAVAVAIVVSTRLGDSDAGKLVTVSITAGIVALSEWGMDWGPKHFAWVRRKLDPRSIFAGVWVQEVVHMHGSEGPPPLKPNRFALFSIAYVQPTDAYALEGTAYDDAGREHARWQSVDVMHFAKDGRSMTYLWEGTITNPEIGPDDPRRTGFARVVLSSDDAGRGRVEHVALRVNLEFNMRRVSKEWLAERRLGRFRPDDPRDPGRRDAFALEFARTLRPRQAVDASRDRRRLPLASRGAAPFADPGSPRDLDPAGALPINRRARGSSCG